MNYASIEPDPGYSTDALPPEQWPSEGSLTLQDVSLTYLQDVPKVLKNISFSVAPKEKVGVAGRTGAGKSSLVAALFRMPEPEGKVRNAIIICLKHTLEKSSCLLLVSLRRRLLRVSYFPA